MKWKAIYIQVSFLLVSVVLSGCASSNPEDIGFARPDRVKVAADKYILQPPDEIEIHCSKVPEIHLQIQKIRPDGKISFESLGELQAAGKTPGELAEQIREKIMLLYRLTGDHPININIKTYKSMFYYVLGQVYFEGPKEVTGRDTVLTALARARPTILAWTDKIRVIRPSGNKKVKPKIFELSYKRMIEKGDISRNVLLEEGDIVFVPPTILASVGLVVEEVVRPVGRAFGTVNIVQGPPK